MIKKSFVVILAFFLNANFALASETINLPNAGLTPESPFYFLDTGGKN